MRHWICPNCHTRAVDDDGADGLSRQRLGCHHCGFGYMFEILEDFFPPAQAGFLHATTKAVCCPAETACSSSQALPR